MNSIFKCNVCISFWNVNTLKVKSCHCEQVILFREQINFGLRMLHLSNWKECFTLKNSFWLSILTFASIVLKNYLKIQNLVSKWWQIKNCNEWHLHPKYSQHNALPPYTFVFLRKNGSYLQSRIPVALCVASVTALLQDYRAQKETFQCPLRGS